MRARIYVCRRADDCKRARNKDVRVVHGVVVVVVVVVDDIIVITK